MPLVLVHGSWDSHHDWDLVVPRLADSFRVLTYDRRGHSESERPTGQESVREDVADLAALIEHLGLAPAWVVGNSFGASIILRLAGERPELFRGLIGHEPPLDFSFGIFRRMDAFSSGKKAITRGGTTQRKTVPRHPEAIDLFLNLKPRAEVWQQLLLKTGGDHD